MTNQADFLVRLEAEAARQAHLQQQRMLPAQLDWLTSFVGRYSWQVVLVLSGVTAMILEWWK